MNMEKEIALYREKVKRYYDNEDRLIQYPTKRPLRILALSKIAEKFELSVKYTEKEVNEIIRNSIVFTDIELIRREMFQHRFIGRLRDGSKYWLEEDWKSLYGDYLGEVRGAALDCGENRTEESE